MLSKKTQYGLKALGYLAARFGQGPVLISEIAKKKKIPEKKVPVLTVLEPLEESSAEAESNEGSTELN